MSPKSRLLKIVLSAFLAAAVLGGIAYYFFTPRGQVVEFNYDRDAQQVLQHFYNDWWWLFPGKDYSPEYILKHRVPGKEWYQQKYKGKLNIKVVRKDGKIAAFTTYYKRNSFEGVVQFIYVAPEFRRQGLATLLTKYAVDQLFKMGLPRVTLTTRINNPARKIYEGLGFISTGGDQENGLIFYKIDENTFREGLKKGFVPKVIENLQQEASVPENLYYKPSGA